jgi:hypothetical protein
MFIKFLFLCWLLPVLFFKIQKLNFKPMFKKFASAPKKKDIWQHRFILAAGLKEEAEEVKIEEVEEEEKPLCWKIAYNEKQTNFITTLIFEE